MTKKDYERAAEMVKQMRQNVIDSGCSVEEALNEFRSIGRVEESFAIFFRSDSPRFDERRFRMACK